MKSSPLISPKLVEALESRTLFTHPAGSPYVPFGQDGVVSNYEVIAARHDGYLIGQDLYGNLSLLRPDGTFALPYHGPVPNGSPPANVSADGKYLLLAGNILTRFNKDGSVDLSFGLHGSVSSFTRGTFALSFQPNQVLLDGARIFVVGIETYATNGIFQRIGVERLRLSGSVDLHFGDSGIASNPADSHELDTQSSDARIGPDHRIYISGQFDSNPLVERYSESGQPTGTVLRLQRQ